MARLCFSSGSVRTWNGQLGAAAVEFHVAQLIGAGQVDAAVGGDGHGELLVVGGLDQFVDQLGGQ
ncbi:hypothetical protein [Actinomadura sp. 9N215]|uniref:hypothetical protein n=1 Tax=Actinomadura sp. 9N215 TaxID=3375150 RepID=UPI003787BA80